MLVVSGVRFFAQNEVTQALTLAEAIGKVSGPAVLALILYGLLKGWLVTHTHHEDVVNAMKAHYDSIVAAKDAELAEARANEQWWRDGLMTTLRIGEGLTEDER